MPYRRLRSKLMRIFGEIGPDNMPTTQLNSEGRHPRGDGKDVLIRAFKDGWHRVYGGHVQIAGKPTFVCTAYDDNKKKRGADQATLARAAKGLRPYFERFEDTICSPTGEGDQRRQKGRRR
jgi:hypothetical protein